MVSTLGVNTQPLVYLGIWTNWSKGPTLGSTLTLTQKDGTLLIAGITLFVTYVGTRLWRIFCFALHHIYSTPEAQDSLYHQRQATLRNSDNAIAGLCTWLELITALRSKKSRSIRRLAPITLITTFFVVALSAAQLLSSSIGSMTGTEVVLQGSSCGVNVLGHYIPGQDKNPEVEQNPQFFTVFLPFLVKRLAFFSNYAINCYSSISNPRDCNFFVNSQLTMKTNRNASCPFEDEICRSGSGNIYIDTGFLNSHLDFGMNAPPGDRWVYRRTTHCAPIKTDGYTRTINMSNSGQNTSYREYLYGGYTTNNVSYRYPDMSFDDMVATLKGSGWANKDYTAWYNYANVVNGTLSANHGFKPIPALFKNDSDVTLLFLSRNQVVSPVEINDPWYAAHQKVPGYAINFKGWENLTLGGYLADEPVSVLACAKQYQLCYPDMQGHPRNCSPLGGKQELYYLLNTLQQTKRQLNLTKWGIMAALTGNEMDTFIQTFGSAALDSKFSLTAGTQGPLPDNQWQTDIERLVAASLAAIQGSAVDSATGPAEANMHEFWAAPGNEEERHVCRNQKILSTAHANFSVFGLFFTLGMGILIIVISYVAEPLTNAFQERYKSNQYSRLEWITNGTLQLQRLAHEEAGFGSWDGLTKDVPTCEEGEKLACLDISDCKHPSLKKRYEDKDMGSISIESERIFTKLSRTRSLTF